VGRPPGKELLFGSADPENPGAVHLLNSQAPLPALSPSEPTWRHHLPTLRPLQCSA
jgi:hypothetical protein